MLSWDVGELSMGEVPGGEFGISLGGMSGICLGAFSGVLRGYLGELSMVGVQIPTRDYKSLRAAVMICATRGLTHTQQTAFHHYTMSYK